MHLKKMWVWLSMALMLLCLLCMFLRLLFVTASDTMLVLNEETILRSRLFRYVYILSGKL